MGEDYRSERTETYHSSVENSLHFSFVVAIHILKLEKGSLAKYRPFNCCHSYHVEYLNRWKNFQHELNEGITELIYIV